MNEVTSIVNSGRGGGQMMDYSRIQADLAGFANTIQNAIGDVMTNGFGVETTPAVDQIVFYGLIALALFIGLRVRKVRGRSVHFTSADKFRRFGLDRYKQI